MQDRQRLTRFPRDRHAQKRHSKIGDKACGTVLVNVPNGPKGQADSRRFLMLQGPHGPFFRQLAAQLEAGGHQVWRVGFNRGDEIFWRRPGYVAFTASQSRWPETCAKLLTRLRITDLVLYGDTRPIHAEAIRLARKQGLRIHVFEEGYLRPYWVTYERDGSNGNSTLMAASISSMRQALRHPGLDDPPPPGHWGDMREHMFYGALYHFCVMTLNRKYPNFRPHRDISVVQEFRLHLRRLLLRPWHQIERLFANARIKWGGFPFHTVLLQLEHDASFQAHSDFRSGREFIDVCLTAFAEGAPVGHHLVFKTHPLEDGRLDVKRAVRNGADRHGLGHRVHFVRGGKLAPLLNRTLSAVTVNSTAGQQVLWRGLPLRIFGRAIYGKPELVSAQTLKEFFSAPARPDRESYQVFRQFLLETSQFPGGYYSESGRRRLLALVAKRMLLTESPYALLDQMTGAAVQQLAVSE